MARLTFFKNIVKKGVPWSLNGITEGIAAIDKAITNMRVFGGYVSWSPDGIPTIIINGAFGSGSGGNQPFDYKFSGSTLAGWTIDFTGCWLKSGSYVLDVGDAQHEMTHSVGVGDTDIYIGVEYDTTAKTAAIISGPLFTDGGESEAPAEIDAHKIKVLLYHAFLTVTGSGPTLNENWSVDFDWRKTPSIGAWSE